jgi:ubiquinone/menaquinone biosynthesis C-methylase UbiE
MNETISIPGHVALMLLGATTASVAAAAQSGLLEALAEEPASAADLAARVGLHPFATERVLDVLVRAGLAVRHAEGYCASPPLLHEPQGPSGSIAAVVKMWSALPEYLHSGQGYYFHGRQTDAREKSYGGTVSRLGRMLSGPAQTIATALADRGSAPRRILDVGAGSGIWSLAMARLHPQAHVTALDLPGVLDDFRATAKTFDLEARIATIGADYHQAELEPSRFDRVVMANVLHLEEAQDAARVVQRIAPAVAPGGEIVIIDAMSDGSPTADDYVAAYALHLALRTGHGRPHTELQLRAWLSAAGFAEATRVPAGPDMPGLAALVASR